MTRSRPLVALLTAVVLGFVLPGPLASQIRQSRTGPAVTQPAKSAGATKAPTAAKKQNPPNPREVKILLMDGSIVLGELSVDAIEVKTEFGTLTVPVEKVLSITPGLDSHTELSAKITRLIRELGGDDYKQREAAHKELLALGPAVRDVVAAHREDKNAERKRRATEIVAKMDEMNASDDSFFSGDSEKRKTWSRDDTVVTPNFTIVGDVSPSVFDVRSRYGPLKIGLKDIRRAERPGLEKEPSTRQVSVAGSNFHLVNPKSSGVRVKAGDTVNVVATGTLVLTPWGSTARSGPDGVVNYGSYTISGQRMGYGALVARVGNSGNWIRVGSRARFTAPGTGELKFGIVMRSTYTRGNYVFPGGYKLRIKVDPKN